MEITKVLKAMADETRFKILKLLLHHNYCVRALSKKLGITESAISQHIKVLKEANLIVGARKGYYMHYDVNRDMLQKLAIEIKELAAIKRKVCHAAQAKSFCHNQDREKGGVREHGNCKSHKS